MRLRALARRVLPPRVKAMVGTVRQLVGQPPIDDGVLARYRFTADDSPRARLTFVIPNLARSTAFGGVITGIAIVLESLIRMRGQSDVDFRVILTDPDRETDTSILLDAAQRAGIDPGEISIERIASPVQAVPVRMCELFVTYNWWTTLNTQPLIEAQTAHYARPAKPVTYLIQEYEPHMYPFSSAHMLSREAYDTPPRLWGVFNSSNLYDYFRLVGHETERAFVFEPVIGDSLRPFLDAVPTSRREKRIVVYGRPGIARNCFPAIVRGLRRWAADYPQFAGWDVVSAGTAHKPVALGDGRTMASVGKLSLEDYAQLMLTSSVGLSLMASPHPSYPPLEMAHMGLRTITNAYACKDLSGFHPNIVSIGSMAESPLAAAIAGACADAAAPVSDYRNETYVRAEKYPFMDDLARSLLAALAQ